MDDALGDLIDLDPVRLRTPARPRSIAIGDVQISYVNDGWIQLNPQLWFSDSTPEFWNKNRRYLDADGYLAAGMGGLLIERDGQALLIDAGFGPGEVSAGPNRPRIGAISGGKLLESLNALGRTPGEINTIAFTHLHLDHIGWVSAPAPATGRPPFAHARAVVPKAEWDHGTSPDHGPFPETMAALEPRLDLAVDGQEVFPGVRLLATPGHSAGHAAYEITAGAQTVIAFGDLFHSPMQVRHPEWSAQPDIDSGSSVHYRQSLLERLTLPGTYGFGIHFADVAFGRVRRDQDGFAWQPVETTLR